MSKLELQTNRFDEPDEAYRLLIDAHRGLDDAASAALNARLVLVLANQLGDLATLREAVQAARKDLQPDPLPSDKDCSAVRPDADR